MRFILVICFCLLSGLALYSQTREIDSLRDILNENTEYDSTRHSAITKLVNCFNKRLEVDSSMKYGRMKIHFLPALSDSVSFDSTDIWLLSGLAGDYQFYKLDSSLLFSKWALEGSKQLNYRSGEAWALVSIGEHFRLKGDFPLALEYLFKGMRISKEINDTVGVIYCNIFIGCAYYEMGEYQTGLNYLLDGMANSKNFDPPIISFGLSNIGTAYMNLNLLDSALLFQEKADAVYDSLDMKFSALNAQIQSSLGEVYFKMGKPGKAMVYYKKAIQAQDYLTLGKSQYLLSELFYSLGKADSSLHYARKAYRNNQHSQNNKGMMDASRILAKLYSLRGMTDSAFYYQGITLALRDSLYSPDNFKMLQLMAVREQQIHYEDLQKKELAIQEEKALKNKIRIYGLISALIFLLLIAFILLRNNRLKQKANALLKVQKEEVSLQREKAEKALGELKSTQSQLIQSEKMASLGELTAGIAHEIQNPLNFVNNFSELSKELIGEMNDELAVGNWQFAKEIAGDIEQNLEKINHHGKRAADIVKGMLQHSRTSSGVKEPTDINTLADEYLRLAYHGLRAKDKSFNAEYKTDFDPTLPKINVIPQDIGRVLLNLINNAFYAVQAPHNTAPPPPEGGIKNTQSEYKPTVTVGTTSWNPPSGGRGASISVKDNGPGIPSHIIDKIFQPFFTTKPTGQGTGLGLSLAYDIVKAHGGELKVETKEGEGSEFIIQIPVNQ